MGDEPVTLPFIMLATMRSARRCCSVLTILGPSIRERARVEWVDVSELTTPEDNEDASNDVDGGEVKALHRAEYVPGGELRAADKTLTVGVVEDDVEEVGELRGGELTAGTRIGDSSPLLPAQRVRARNFLCGLYASSIRELVSKRGGAWRTRFKTGMSSTLDWPTRPPADGAG